MKNKEIKILLAAPRGFCAGVDRAIEIVKKSIKKFGTPVYVRHEIVHNKYVVDNLKKIGAIFVEKLDEIKDKTRPVIFSAHGVPKSVPEEAKNLNIEYIDATCPLVTKVHLQIHKYALDNIDVILIGHDGHPEVEGTMGQYTSEEGKIYLVENKNDVANLNIKNSKISYVTQTTLSVDDTQNIVDCLKKKYPHIQGPKKDDICYATQNRQEAVKKILNLCDSLIVVGSQNSSNSQRLKEIAVHHGKNAYLIDHESQLDINDLSQSKVIGITAGASAPEHTVQSLIKFLIQNGAIMSTEEIDFKDEAVVFSLPKSLRQ